MNANVVLKAKIKMPKMPNFVELQNITAATLDHAIANNSGSFIVDVADMDDDALTDFCNAWVVAFVAHAKGRRKGAA